MISEIVNKANVLSRLDGDEELFREIIGIFLTDSQFLVEQISAAVISQDAEGLERAAHKLKGAVSTFTSGEASSAAEQLETMGREHDLRRAGEALGQLKGHIGILENALSGLKAEAVPNPES